LLQQWSPQQRWSSLQHVSPQHVADFLQQMSDGQHFSVFEQHLPAQHASPFVQQVFPHVREPFGHGLQVPRPVPGEQRVPRLQHVPRQQCSSGLQQETVFPPLQTVSLAAQQYSRSGSAHTVPTSQHLLPHLRAGGQKDLHRTRPHRYCSLGSSKSHC